MWVEEMKTSNNLMNEAWHEQVQIRKLIWESERKFWKRLSEFKEYITKKKSSYKPTHRWD